MKSTMSKILLLGSLFGIAVIIIIFTRLAMDNTNDTAGGNQNTASNTSLSTQTPDTNQGTPVITPTGNTNTPTGPADTGMPQQGSNSMNPGTAGQVDKTNGTDEKNVPSPTKTKDGNSGSTPAPTSRDNPKPTAVSGSRETAMTDTEFQKLKDNVAHIDKNASNAANAKINPLMLSLSGLGPVVEAMKGAQAELEKQVVEFNSIADGIKALELKGGVRDKVMVINSEIFELCISLDKKLIDLKAAKKNKDIDAIEALLKDISGIISSAEGEVEILNRVLEKK